MVRNLQSLRNETKQILLKSTEVFLRPFLPFSESLPPPVSSPNVPLCPVRTNARAVGGGGGRKPSSESERKPFTNERVRVQ